MKHYGGGDLLAEFTPCGHAVKSVPHDDDWRQVTCRDCREWLASATRTATVALVLEKVTPVVRPILDRLAALGEKVEPKGPHAARPVVHEEMDETEYLLSSPANAAHLRRGIQQVNSTRQPTVAQSEEDGARTPESRSGPAIIAESAGPMVCLVCEAPLKDNGMEGRPAQPDRGVIVHIPGNYGSTVYDEPGSRLVAHLCDSCLTDRAREGMVLQVDETPQAPMIEVKTWRPHEYTVTYVRNGAWWFISVPELGIYSQAALREEIAYMARDAIALTLDIPLGDFSIRLVQDD